MGNITGAQAKHGESVTDYLRRKFNSKTRKIDKLVAQELREEEMEHREDTGSSESLRRIEAIGQRQSGIPHQLMRQHDYVTSRQTSRPALPEVTSGQSRRDGRPTGHQENWNETPYRSRILVQDSTHNRTRTLCQDVLVDSEFVEERICYEETYLRRRIDGGPTVIVSDFDDETRTTGPVTEDAPPQENARLRRNRHTTDLMPVSQNQERTAYRSRLSRLRQMTLSLFRSRRSASQEPDLEDTNNGDFFDQPRAIEYDWNETVGDKTDVKDTGSEDKDVCSRPQTGDSDGRSSRLSLRDKARPVNNGGVTMISEGCRTPISTRGGAARKKSGDVAIQKGPDRGIVWPKKLEDVYSITDKAYYIEQFQRTELFRQRTMKKEQGSETWMKALTPFQIWVIEHVDTKEMAAILKPKTKYRPNNSKAKVDSWRGNTSLPKRSHKMED